MGVDCSSRSVRVSHVLSSSTPACRNEDVSASELELELASDEDKLERSVKAAVVLISEQVEPTLELMLKRTEKYRPEYLDVHVSLWGLKKKRRLTWSQAPASPARTPPRWCQGARRLRRSQLPEHSPFLQSK